MRVTRRGQVTIPQDIRRLAGLLPGSEVEFHVRDGKVVLEKVELGPIAERQRVQAEIRSVVGSATAVPALATDEIRRITRGD
jgi:AbrB family looped-hinge helix DNA binding protein